MVTKDADENFSIDDLLNLSNDEAVDVPFIIDGGSANGEKVDIVTANDGELGGGFDKAKEKLKGKVECAEERSYCPHADASLYAELCVPPEQLAELEWVSNFLDESLSPEDNKKLQLIRGTHTQSVSISVSNSFSGSGFDSGSGSGFDSGSISSSPENPLLQYRRRIATRGRRPALNSRSAVPMIADSEYSESRRKQPKPVRRNSFSSEGMKCTHCGTEKTPQWRTGPKGPKSLCNACGVRYKSGRLVPEYRPAASPTFEESKHSNSHRKVMELRTKKTMMMMQDRLMDSDSA